MSNGPIVPPFVHPCLNCGACCAFFRVSFYWQETEKGFSENPVPVEATIPVNNYFLCMRGTDRKPSRCGSLDGELGKEVSCSIYSNRPSSCRDFEASYENGTRNLRCDEARFSLGLRPLSPEDWRSKPSPSDLPPRGPFSPVSPSRRKRRTAA